MSEFDFEKLEKNLDVLAQGLKIQMQTRLFHPIAPPFDVDVRLFDKGRGYGKAISVETNDIAEYQNFKMFEKIFIHNFGGSILKGEPLYWLPIDWRWVHKEGGGNGTRAFTCYVNDDGKIVEVKE